MEQNHDRGTKSNKGRSFMKQVQISEELFNRICAWFLLDHRDELQENIICNGLEEKLRKMQARSDYYNALNTKNERGLKQ